MTSIRRPRALACIALLVLLGFSLGFSEFTVIGIEPELAEAFDVPLARVGELISFFSVAYAVLTPLLAVSTGRFKRFTLLIVYVALFCVSNIMMTFAPTFEVLLAARILLGAVSGALLAVGVTFIPELVGVHRMSMMISVVYAAFSVAMVVATSVGKIVAEVLNWHAVMIIALVLALAVSAAMLAVLPRHGSTDEPSTVREQAGLLTEPQILVGIAIFLFGVGSVYVFYGYVTPYLEDVLSMDAVGASMTLMVYGVMCFVSNLISGWVDLRYGMKALLVVFPVQALFLVALFLVSPAMPWSLVPVMLVGLSMYVVSVSCISLFMRVARERHPKAMVLASSLEPMAFNIGIAFGTAIGGAVVSGPGSLTGVCADVPDTDAQTRRHRISLIRTRKPDMRPGHVALSELGQNARLDGADTWRGRHGGQWSPGQRSYVWRQSRRFSTAAAKWPSTRCATCMRKASRSSARST